MNAQIETVKQNERRVAELIQARGHHLWSATQIAAEAELCRQTVYKIIARLNDKGYNITRSGKRYFVRAVVTWRAA